MNTELKCVCVCVCVCVRTTPKFLAMYLEELEISGIISTIKAIPIIKSPRRLTEMQTSPRDLLPFFVLS